MSRSAAKWILRNTLVSRESLTPEFSLRLITEASPLWMATPEHCPLADPYWAFYWPGGQAVTRWLLDNASSAVRGAALLDLGAGCGSATLAAIAGGAADVIVNDIDENALLATRLNARLNGVPTTMARFSTVNLLAGGVDGFVRFFEQRDRRLIILGDMFYDTDFAGRLFEWLKRAQKGCGARVIVGDPDRHPLVEQRHLDGYQTNYALPGYIQREHYGFSSAHVYELEFV